MKQLSGAMALVGLVLLIPNVPRVVRFALGRSTGPAVSGHIWRNRIFVRITRWVSPILAVIILVGSGLAAGTSFDWGRPRSPEELSGVYAVTASGKPAPIEGTDHTTEDITQIAFGQIGYGKDNRMSRWRLPGRPLQRRRPDDHSGAVPGAERRSDAHPRLLWQTRAPVLEDRRRGVLAAH